MCYKSKAHLTQVIHNKSNLWELVKLTPFLPKNAERLPTFPFPSLRRWRNHLYQIIDNFDDVHMVGFEWDLAKNKSNQEKYGISFEEAKVLSMMIMPFSSMSTKIQS